MAPELAAALGRYLLTLADDELVLGYRDSEWTAVAPMVEEDVAFSSLAQDEIGHARLYYTLAGELLDADPDHLALLRPKDAYYHARLVERRATPRYVESGEHLGGGDWALAVARRFLYDLFDDLRTESLLASTWAPLAGATRKVRREETYHLRHGEAWWSALARGQGEAPSRLAAALVAIWPDLLGLFEEAPGEEALVAAGLIGCRTSALRDPWLERVAARCEPVGMPFAARRGADGWQLLVEPALGGRQGRHGAGWDELYEDMTMVRRLEPEGVW
ncbi:MAG TPA: 1,2-phenylacetyl-CoA epoxidase subunit PaaC [Thermomicrobiaceae bacterium]|nr:1,2-phenylacetyl-CoA epoxidase subunit PaaC [Thermomicrobiaceae bacterium]